MTKKQNMTKWHRWTLRSLRSEKYGTTTLLKTSVDSRWVKNVLADLLSWNYIEHIKEEKYKITDLGIKELNDLE